MQRPGVAGRQPVLRRARDAGARRRRQVPRARGQRRRRRRGAHRDDVRGDARRESRSTPAGCHLPHGLSYAVSGLRATGTSTAIRTARRWCRTAWRWCSTIRRCGGTRRRRTRRATSSARNASAPTSRGATPDDAGEVLASRVIELMRATGMPNGLSALGFGESDDRRARHRRRAAVPRDQERARRRRPRRDEVAVPRGAALLVAACGHCAGSHHPLRCGFSACRFRM